MQIAQAGAARAKVIHGQTKPHRMQGLEVFQRHGAVVQHDAFRDLQYQITAL